MFAQRTPRARLIFVPLCFSRVIRTSRGTEWGSSARTKPRSSLTHKCVCAREKWGCLLNVCSFRDDSLASLRWEAELIVLWYDFNRAAVFLASFWCRRRQTNKRNHERAMILMMIGCDDHRRRSQLLAALFFLRLIVIGSPLLRF